VTHKIEQLLQKASSFSCGLLAIFVIAIVGGFDFWSGYEFSMSVFYILPVWIAARYVGRGFSVFVCVTAVAVWLAVDIGSGHQYRSPSIPIWNASVRLSLFLIVAQLINRLRTALKTQEALARQDDLTGLLNGRSFHEMCDLVLSLARRNGRTFAIGYLDLDGFKSVNDSLGHGVGDQVLKAVSDAVSKRLRTSDFSARLGGDEFAILLPETEIAGAQEFFTSLHKALSELAVLNHWPVGFSIGVAVFNSPILITSEAIRIADELMYKVKKSEKNNLLVEAYSGNSVALERIS
jgi:diguanylate cyclase (GGDEF)-like protein